MEPIPKRESILHAQNIFLTAPVNIYPHRETGKYVIGYEPKAYRVHSLLYKISKELTSKTENPIKIQIPVDVNIREDFRNSIKFSDPKTYGLMKNLVIRIVPTRYNNFRPLYGIIYQFRWRQTGAGGVDQIKFSIFECPTIVNSDTINNVCYKKIASQRSFGGTHGTYTFIIISPQRGQYTVGEWVHYSNVNAGGHHHGYTRPFTISI